MPTHCKPYTWIRHHRISCGLTFLLLIPLFFCPSVIAQTTLSFEASIPGGEDCDAGLCEARDCESLSRLLLNPYACDHVIAASCDWEHVALDPRLIAQMNRNSHTVETFASEDGSGRQSDLR